MKSFYLLFKFSVRHLWRQKWQSFLLIIGILLGVAVVIAIDYANASSRKAINISTQSLTGSATHQILSSSTGISDNYFTDMKRKGIFDVASPIVEGYVNVLDFNQQPKLVLGIDPLLDFPFRTYYGRGENQLSQLFSVISEPDSGIISKNIAEEFGINLGQIIKFQTEGRIKEIKIVGFVSSDEPIVQDSLNGLIIVDISTAQEIFNKEGLLDRIELILKDDKSEELVKENLTSDLILRTTKEQSFQIENMVAAFQLNLTALSLLALVVGSFLIYNTMTFSVVQRRELIGLYRSLGFYRSDIFLMIIIEAIIIGIIGTLFGVVVGSLLGKGTVNLILQTINDLYYVTTVKSVTLPAESVIKGVVLGIFATILVSIPPAWEATQVTPRTAKIRSNFEDKVKKYIGYFLVLGLLLIGASYFLLFSPTFQNLWWSFTATLFVVIAFSIFTAILLFLFLPPLSKFIKRKIGMIPGMATRELYRSLSRTAVAVASLMVAVAVTIGMAIMINSFRNTVSVWLRETLSGDIYVSVPNQFSNRSSAYIDQSAASEILSYNGIKKFDTLLTINGISSGENIQINVITNQDIAYERMFIELSTSKNDVWNELLSQKILISEPLANRLNLKLGGVLTIESPEGPQDFLVSGIFSDYTSNQGYIMMARPVFEQYWNNPEITAISLTLDDGIEIQSAVNDLKENVSKFDQILLIRSNQSLRNDVMVVFDRTFAITDALRFIATIVSFIGILSATLIILIDRKKEFGMLKAIGMKNSELSTLVFTETGLMGLFAGIFAIPTGIIISLILVYVINLRSFGWTIQLDINIWSLVQGVAIAVIAALLATIYPLKRLNQLKPIQVIRDE